jgi:hypothetical protein
MTANSTRSISKLAYVIGTAVFLLAAASFFPAVVHLVPASVSATAAVFVLVATGALLAVYILLSAGGALDRPVSLGRLVPDAWQSILVSTVMVGIAWGPLSQLVAPHSTALRLLAPVGVIVTVGLAAHRVFRLHGGRPTAGKAQPDPRAP